MTTQQLQQLDKQHLWHPFTPMSLWFAEDPLVITAAEGMHLIDSDGRRYLDGVSSLWCNVHGHRVPEIDAAVKAQLDKVAHSTMLGLASEPAILLADKLLKLVPRNLKKIFYSDSGATATEIAFKLAAQYWFNKGITDKNEFIGFADAYHGDTFGAMSVGRDALYHRPYWPMLFKTHVAPIPRAQGHGFSPAPGTPGEGWGGGIFGFRVSDFGFRTNPHPDRPPEFQGRETALAALEKLLQQRANHIAGICIEPIVQGAAGMLIQPPGFLSAVRALATKYDTLLIADEVAVGFGRTGKMFACEHENVQPDLMCLAKGISGGYLPLAATLASQEIFDAFLGDPAEGKTFYHGHTYTGNPLACAAGIASLELFEKHDLIANVQRKSVELAGMLDDLNSLAHVGEIRQKGFMVGIELVADKRTGRPFDPRRRTGAEICQRIRRHGVILRPLGDVIILMPPLAMDIADLSTIVASIKEETANLTDL